MADVEVVAAFTGIVEVVAAAPPADLPVSLALPSQASAGDVGQASAVVKIEDPASFGRGVGGSTRGPTLQRPCRAAGVEAFKGGRVAEHPGGGDFLVMGAGSCASAGRSVRKTRALGAAIRTCPELVGDLYGGGDLGGDVVEDASRGRPAALGGAASEISAALGAGPPRSRVQFIHGSSLQVQFIHDPGSSGIAVALAMTTKCLNTRAMQHTGHH